MTGEMLIFVIVFLVLILIARSIGSSADKPTPSGAFFRSRAWLDIRYQVIRKYGRTCMACGATGGQVHVDHIKPRTTHPHLELEFDNLQVLCRACNFGKSNKWTDDFRPRNRSGS